MQSFLTEGGSRASALSTCLAAHSLWEWYADPLVPHQQKSSPGTFLCPLFPQDLFFKYTWNNFLHFQVELCIAAILSHAAREDRAEASGGPESGVEPPPGNRDSETPQPAASHPENTMVAHLFQRCCLVQRILEAWEANDLAQ